MLTFAFKPQLWEILQKSELSTPCHQKFCEWKDVPIPNRKKVSILETITSYKSEGETFHFKLSFNLQNILIIFFCLWNFKKKKTDSTENSKLFRLKKCWNKTYNHLKHIFPHFIFKFGDSSNHVFPVSAMVRWLCISGETQFPQLWNSSGTCRDGNPRAAYTRNKSTAYK